MSLDLLKLQREKDPQSQVKLDLPTVKPNVQVPTQGGLTEQLSRPTVDTGLSYGAQAQPNESLQQQQQPLEPDVSGLVNPWTGDLSKLSLGDIQRMGIPQPLPGVPVDTPELQEFATGETPYNAAVDAAHESYEKERNNLYESINNALRLPQPMYVPPDPTELSVSVDTRTGDEWLGQEASKQAPNSTLLPSSLWTNNPFAPGGQGPFTSSATANVLTRSGGMASRIGKAAQGGDFFSNTRKDFSNFVGFAGSLFGVFQPDLVKIQKNFGAAVKNPNLETIGNLVNPLNVTRLGEVGGKAASLLENVQNPEDSTYGKGLLGQAFRTLDIVDNTFRGGVADLLNLRNKAYKGGTKGQSNLYDATLGGVDYSLLNTAGKSPLGIIPQDFNITNPAHIGKAAYAFGADMLLGLVLPNPFEIVGTLRKAGTLAKTGKLTTKTVTTVPRSAVDAQVKATSSIELYKPPGALEVRNLNKLVPSTSPTTGSVNNLSNTSLKSIPRLPPVRNAVNVLAEKQIAISTMETILEAPKTADIPVTPAKSGPSAIVLYDKKQVAIVAPATVPIEKAPSTYVVLTDNYPTLVPPKRVPTYPSVLGGEKPIGPLEQLNYPSVKGGSLPVELGNAKIGRPKKVDDGGVPSTVRAEVDLEYNSEFPSSRPPLFGPKTSESIFSFLKRKDAGYDKSYQANKPGGVLPEVERYEYTQKVDPEKARKDFEELNETEYQMEVAANARPWSGRAVDWTEVSREIPYTPEDAYYNIYRATKALVETGISPMLGADVIVKNLKGLADMANSGDDISDVLSELFDEGGVLYVETTPELVNETFRLLGKKVATEGGDAADRAFVEALMNDAFNRKNFFKSLEDDGTIIVDKSGNIVEREAIVEALPRREVQAPVVTGADVISAVEEGAPKAIDDVAARTVSPPKKVAPEPPLQEPEAQEVAQKDLPKEKEEQTGVPQEQKSIPQAQETVNPQISGGTVSAPAPPIPGMIPEPGYDWVSRVEANIFGRDAPYETKALLPGYQRQIEIEKTVLRGTNPPIPLEEIDSLNSLDWAINDTIYTFKAKRPEVGVKNLTTIAEAVKDLRSAGYDVDSVVNKYFDKEGRLIVPENVKFTPSLTPKELEAVSPVIPPSDLTPMPSVSDVLQAKPGAITGESVTPVKRTNQQLTELAVFLGHIKPRKTPLSSKQIQVLEETYGSVYAKEGKFIDSTKLTNPAVRIEVSPAEPGKPRVTKLVDQGKKKTKRGKGKKETLEPPMPLEEFDKLLKDRQDILASGDMSTLKAIDDKILEALPEDYAASASMKYIQKQLPDGLRTNSSSGVTLTVELYKTNDALDDLMGAIGKQEAELKSLQRVEKTNAQKLVKYADVVSTTTEEDLQFSKTIWSDYNPKSEDYTPQSLNPEYTPSRLNPDEELENIVTPELSKFNWYHGTRLDDEAHDIRFINPDENKTLNEYGPGLYLTTDFDSAKYYADAMPNSNLPPGTKVAESGTVQTVVPNVEGRTFIVDNKPTKEILDIFRDAALDAGFTAGQTSRYMRSISKLETGDELWLSISKGEMAKISFVGPYTYHKFNVSVANGLRKAGFGAILKLPEKAGDEMVLNILGRGGDPMPINVIKKRAQEPVSILDAMVAKLDALNSRKLNSRAAQKAKLEAKQQLNAQAQYVLNQKLVKNYEESEALLDKAHALEDRMEELAKIEKEQQVRVSAKESQEALLKKYSKPEDLENPCL